MLAGPAHRDVRPGRERESPSRPKGDEPALSKEGYAEEALPWLDAVYRFALRLTQGDRDTAEDLVQETFVRSYRFWHTFERGTNAKSWLFTICRNIYLNEMERPRSKRELPAADLDTRVESLAAASAFDANAPNGEQAFFDGLIDDQVVQAIDELPEDYREVIVLSDLGDLKYSEIAEVLGIPVGTAKSRLFRARRILQNRLKEFAVQSGYTKGNTS
jgi:RNA polymerase sigma-70 factor (ECF subfamily)